MAYNPNIPNTSDFLSVSQAQIKNNFNDANTIFGFDHITFDASTNQGKHNSVTMPDLTTSLPTQAGVGFGQVVAVHNEFDTGTQPRPTWNDNGGGIYYPMAATVAAGMGTVASASTGAAALTMQQEFNCTVVRTSRGLYTISLSPALVLVSGFYYGVLATPVYNHLVAPSQIIPISVTAQTLATGSFVLTFYAISATAPLTDPDGFSFVVIQF